MTKFDFPETKKLSFKLPAIICVFHSTSHTGPENNFFFVTASHSFFFFPIKLPWTGSRGAGLGHSISLAMSLMQSCTRKPLRQRKTLCKQKLSPNIKFVGKESCLHCDSKLQKTLMNNVLIDRCSSGQTVRLRWRLFTLWEKFKKIQLKVRWNMSLRFIALFD